MSDRSAEPSGFARVFVPFLGIVALAGLVKALMARRGGRATLSKDDHTDSAEGHPS